MAEPAGRPTHTMKGVVAGLTASKTNRILLVVFAGCLMYALYLFRSSVVPLKDRCGPQVPMLPQLVWCPHRTRALTGVVCVAGV